MMWPTRTAFAGLQDAERSTRRTAAEKPKRVQVGVFDLKSHPDRLPGKRTVPIRIPGDELRDLVTLERVTVLRREIDHRAAVGVLDLDSHMTAGAGRVIDLQSSTGNLQRTRGELSASLAAAKRHKTVNPVRETP